MKENQIEIEFKRINQKLNLIISMLEVRPDVKRACKYHKFDTYTNGCWYCSVCGERK